MQIHFPVTASIGKDAEVFMNALILHQEQIKSNIDSQSLLKKITIAALKVLSLVAGVFTVACLPINILMFRTSSLIIGLIALSMTVTCLVLFMLLDPKNPSELIIRDQWKAVFRALRNGEGSLILKTCQVLAKQKEKRLSAFNQCLGRFSVNDTAPFFHKVCLVGYLQMALEYLRSKEDENTKLHAQFGLSHFGSSGFSYEIENFLHDIIESPKNMRIFLEGHQVGKDLHALDYLIAIKNKGLIQGESLD